MFTIRQHYMHKSKGPKYFFSVHGKAGDDAKTFSFVTRNRSTSMDARCEALRAIRQYHVVNNLPDTDTRVIEMIGESAFDETRAFQRTPAKRIRKGK